MFKFKLDSLDGLSDEHKKLYVKKGDKFVLQVEGMENDDVAGLKTQVENLLTEVKTAKASLKTMQDEKVAAEEAARASAEEAARKKGDVTSLEKSWGEKLAKREQELTSKYETDVGSLTKDVERLLIDNVAAGMAREIAVQGSDIALLPHIKSRLKVDVRDGKRTTVVVDANGQPSALSLEDLSKEFVGNAAFAPVIAGSKASGGGAGGAKPGGAGGAKTMKRADFETLDPAGKQKAMKDGTTLTD
jgi:hypothetical protein